MAIYNPTAGVTRSQRRWAVSPAAIIGGGVAAVVLIAVLLTMQTGLHGDPRTTNPNPSPRPHEPLLGVENWPITSTWIFVGIALVLIAVLIRLSRAEGRMHVAAIVFLSFPLMSLTDPVANWVTFTVFDPRTPHFPMSWTWVNHAPLVEPILALLGGYPMYYLTVSLVLAAGYRRVVAPRVPVGSFPERHPLLGVFLFVLVVGVPIDTAANLIWMRADLYLYTQGFGPQVHWAHATLPMLWVFYDVWVFACTALLLQRDDHGRSLLLCRWARRLPLGGSADRASSPRQIAAGGLFLLAIVMVPIGLYGVLRVSGMTHPVYDKYPYTEAKVYDPYDDISGSGRLGPYYR